MSRRQRRIFSLGSPTVRHSFFKLNMKSELGETTNKNVFSEHVLPCPVSHCGLDRSTSEISLLSARPRKKSNRGSVLVSLPSGLVRFFSDLFITIQGMFL